MQEMLTMVRSERIAISTVKIAFLNKDLQLYKVSHPNNWLILPRIEGLPSSITSYLYPPPMPGKVDGR